MLALTALFLLLTAAYAVGTYWLDRQWRAMPVVEPALDFPQAAVDVSVVVPVRDEAANVGALLADLDRQTHKRFEVFVVDDGSQDGTRRIVAEAKRLVSYELRLLKLPAKRYGSPKKAAIALAVSKAAGDLILTTDGDCRVGPEWVASFAGLYALKRPKLISGPVTFYGERTAFERMQTVEFASLVGTGGACLHAGHPNMCNGANLAYEKSAFESVGGFAGFEHVASGDDEFLLHKVSRKFPGGAVFLKSRLAIVRTRPQPDWKGFFQQRKRWASKWRHYADWRPKALAWYVLALHASLLAALALTLAGAYPLWALLAQAAAKFPLEFLFLDRILTFLGHRKKRNLVFPVQLAYPLYVTLVGLAAQRGGYEWKGRRHEREAVRSET